MHELVIINTDRINARFNYEICKCIYFINYLKHNADASPKNYIIIPLSSSSSSCMGIDALSSFPGASAISSSSSFVVEGVFRQSGVVHSFKMVEPVSFVFESHVLYFRDL